ncbi:MAG: hypothetical protein RI963_874 [Planctomycetota bacterium]
MTMALEGADPIGVRLRANWEGVLEEVAAAAAAAGRDPGSVRVIGVTKYVGAEVTRSLVGCGCLDLGESRPQQLEEKSRELADLAQVRWHMIGSLQRNKARKVARVAAVVHSIDTPELLIYLDRVAGEEGRQIDGLLEVNLSGEASKHGFTAERLFAAAPSLVGVRNVRLVGLMGMAGLDATADQTRRQFASLREMSERLAAQTGLGLAELSMGMSGDFVAAIAEGATMVRIGSRLFEGVSEG